MDAVSQIRGTKTNPSGYRPNESNPILSSLRGGRGRQAGTHDWEKDGRTRSMTVSSNLHNYLFLKLFIKQNWFHNSWC